MKRFHVLTDEELRIIEHKGTEPPFTNHYDDFYEPGIYVCKRCDAPLYISSAKFSSGCGWPSFDEEIPHAVAKLPDPDGRRTEILCAFCGSHLGHVFMGEQFTKKNTRHCVNSISIKFCPLKTSDGLSRAYFAGGCFWGIEYWFERSYGLKVRSGYMGGHVVNPSYEEVCTGLTGHREVVEVLYDEKRISYEDVTKLFFEIHDCTQKDGQGPDKGFQYTSAIYYLTTEQKDTAYSLIHLLEQKGYRCATAVIPASTFYLAEDYHQGYYLKKEQEPYCHKRTQIF